jgi:ATPase subunit of ABC transporter with duplicated ATPase domains
MSFLITLDRLSFRAPDGRALFEDLSLTFGRERTGLVGRNGVGKTTLARLILGELAPASGAVVVRGRLARLAQVQALPDGATVADLTGLADPLARLARIEAGEGSDADFEAADWTLPARLEAAMRRMGLPPLDPARPAATLSGGQVTRALLAALLAAEPDFIILDEPTNNLDAEGRGAVEAMLADWTGGAMVISHDRRLLEGMDRIVELSALGARVYGGGYGLYTERKALEEAAATQDLEMAERRIAQAAREAQAAAERKAKRDAAGKRSRAKSDMPKSWLDGQAERAENSLSRQSGVDERRQADAEAALDAAKARVERVRRLAFELPSAHLATGRQVLAFEDVGFAWPGAAPVLSGVSFRVNGPERVALTGPNGSGKTTLIGLAVGALEPTSGRITRGVRAVALDQRAEALDDRQTLFQNFRRLNPEAGDNAARAALARFLFRNVAADRPAGDMSGGERLRAALACVLMAAEPPQLIVLDEPTNHLDLDSIEAIEAALAGYDGALIIASHDEAFLAAVGVERRIALGAAGGGAGAPAEMA